MVKEKYQIIIPKNRDPMDYIEMDDTEYTDEPAIIEEVEIIFE